MVVNVALADCVSQFLSAKSESSELRVIKELIAANTIAIALDNNTPVSPGRFMDGQEALQCFIKDEKDWPKVHTPGSPDLLVPKYKDRRDCLKKARLEFGAAGMDALVLGFDWKRMRSITIGLEKADYSRALSVMMTSVSLAVLNLLSGESVLFYVDTALAAAARLEKVKPSKRKRLDTSPINWNPYAGTRMESVARRTGQDSGHILGELTFRGIEALFDKAADIKPRRVNADQLNLLMADVRQMRFVMRKWNVP